MTTGQPFQWQSQGSSGEKTLNLRLVYKNATDIEIHDQDGQQKQSFRSTDEAIQYMEQCFQSASQGGSSR